MKKIIITIAAVSLLTVYGCSGMNLNDYTEFKPEFNLKDYFSGPIKGWGIVQERSGKVVSRFDVKLVGSWEGDQGTLRECFDYYGGERDTRIWKITAKGNDLFEGTAGDILDKAEGEQKGGAMRWKYRMDLPVNGSTYRITFDDWIWQLNDGVIVNRSYLKKFGFVVAELTLFMQKQDKGFEDFDKCFESSE